jgi:hypothetical protein
MRRILGLLLVRRRGMRWSELGRATHPYLPGHAGEGREGKGFESLVGAIERSEIEVPEVSAAALCDVLRVPSQAKGPMTAAERTEDGRFDDLSVKSVAHFALAEACRRIKLNALFSCPSCATQASEVERDGNFGFPDRHRGNPCGRCSFDHGGGRPVVCPHALPRTA